MSATVMWTGGMAGVALAVVVRATSERSTSAVVRARLAGGHLPGGGRLARRRRLDAHLASLALPMPHSFAANGSMIIVAAAGSAVVFAAGVGGLRVAGVAVLGLAGAWAVAVRGAESRRLAGIDGELPALLEAVARQLRAGASLTQALTGAAPRPGGALEPSWEQTTSSIREVGVAEACSRWRNRPQARPAERLAATALALAADTGGAPARAVDGVAGTLRSRQALSAELRALTSSARASAAMIALAPVAFGGLAAVTDPRTSAFTRTTEGTALFCAGLVLDGLGWWWMARLCRIAP